MPPTAKITPMAPVSFSRVCATCGHRLLRVVLDTGERLEVDTQRRCWVSTGREHSGIPVYSGSRAYPEHPTDCPGKGERNA